MSGLIQALPRQTAKILSLIEEQKMTMRIAITDLEGFYKRLDSLAACIALGIISAGLAVGGSLVIHAKIKPLWHDISMFGLLGYIMAVVLGMWVIFIFGRKHK